MDIRGFEPDETIISIEEYRDRLIQRLLDGDEVLHTILVGVGGLSRGPSPETPAPTTYLLACS